jgi:hypothetical protein
MRDKLEIYHALGDLMSACGFSGESGTERLFPVLLEATEAVDVKWDSVVGQSHRQGMSIDVNGLLADEIASILKKREKMIREAPEGWNPPSEKLENLGK